MTRSPRRRGPSSIRSRSRSSCSAIEAAAETSRSRRVAARAEGGDQVDRRGRAGEQLVGQRAELEPLRHGVARRQQLVGAERLQQGRVGDERAAVRAEELVGRADHEVGAHRGEVGGGVRGVVDAVDVEQRAHLVRAGGDRGDGRPGAEQVGGRGHRDEPGALGDRVERRQVELGGLRVEPQPPHGDPGALGRLDPRPHVGVVVELAEDDLVARRPGARQRAGEVVRQRRRAAAVDDALGHPADQVGDGGAEAGDGLLGVALARRRGAALRQRPGQRPGDRLADHPRGLGAAGVVEVGDARTRARGTRRGRQRRRSGMPSDASWRCARPRHRSSRGAPRCDR